MEREVETNKSERILNLEWELARLRERCNELDRDNIRLSTTSINSNKTMVPYWDDYDETWRCGNVKCDAQIEREDLGCAKCWTLADWEEAEHGRD